MMSSEKKSSTKSKKQDKIYINTENASARLPENLSDARRSANGTNTIRKQVTSGIAAGNK
jgi:hypothetical protein